MSDAHWYLVEVPLLGWCFYNVLKIMGRAPWNCHCLRSRKESLFQKLAELWSSIESPERRSVGPVRWQTFHSCLELTELLGIFVLLLHPVPAPRLKFLCHWVEPLLPLTRQGFQSYFSMALRDSHLVILGLQNKFYYTHNKYLHHLHQKQSAASHLRSTA